MKYKQIIFFIALIVLSFKSNSQTGLALEYKSLYNSTIVTTSWSNCKALLFSNYSTFKATMNKYNYSLATAGSCYIANTSVGSPYYTIKKETDGLTMAFTEQGDFISNFRTEIRKMLGEGASVSYEKGFEVYYVSLQYDGFKHNLKIILKDDDNGGVVGLILQ